MIRIYCTGKLQKLIGTVETNLPYDTIHRSILDWNAHVFFVDKRKCLVFVNNLTYYTIFIADVKKKDLKNIENLFFERLNEQLYHDGIINQDESFEVLTGAKEISFFRTNNDRKAIGRINDFAYLFKAHRFHKYGHLHAMDVVYESGILNGIPVGKPDEDKKSWSKASSNMKEVLTAHNNK